MTASPDTKTLPLSSKAAFEPVRGTPRNPEAYRDATRAIIRVINVQAVIIFFLLVGLIFTVTQIRPADRFFAMTLEGRKMQIPPLSQPNINIEAILDWATGAAVDVMTFGFHDLNQRFAKTRTNFTAKGWQSFRKAILSSGLFKTVTRQQQILTAIPRGLPVVLFEGMRDGYYTWDIRIPLMLTARAGGQAGTASPTLILTVVRVPTAANPHGLAIHKWFMF